MTPARRDRRNTEGIAVDASGGPVIDPTENVLALVEAAVKRQDDLRVAQDRFLEAELMHVRLTESLRAEHAVELNRMESSRLDAIRQVDVQNGALAAASAADAIRVLAATTAANAEKLRTDLQATAATMAKQTADVAATMAAQQAGTVAGITERIAALEKSSYEGIGKGRVADPIMADFMADMKTMLRQQSSSSGKTEGINASWGVLLGGAGLVVAIIIAVFAGMGKQSQPQPQVVYVPAQVQPQAPSSPSTTTITRP